MPEQNAEQELLQLVKEIRDNQQKQIAQQSEFQKLQVELSELFRKQYDRASDIQDRAEAVQERGRALMAGAQRAVRFILGAVAVLLAILVWLLLRFKIR